MLTGYPKVSVIVLNYNGIKYATKCFTSLEKQTYPNYEVIMVDNASTDDSASYVRQHFPWVKIISNSVNMGYAKANNEAAKQVEGGYILFLNMDTWVKSNLLDVLVSEVINDAMIGACACTQLSYDGKRRLNTGMTIDIMAYPIVPEAGEQILYSDGASLFVNKRFFLQLGGFDSEYFMYAEDVDLCWRMLLAGYDVVSVSSAIIGHKSAGTFVLSGETYRINKLRRYLAERNSLRSILKNYSAHNLICILPLRFTITTFQVMFFFLIRHPDFINAEANAIVWNLRKLKETFALRSIVQRNRRVSDRIIVRRMSKAVGVVRSFAAIQQDSLGVDWKEK
ncbi:MAG: glycosyltransferase family 2 protein [Bacteroidales bacterium]